MRRRRALARIPAVLLGVGLLIWTLLPVYNMLLIALSDDGDEFTGAIWPDDWNWHSFQVVWTEGYWYLDHFWHQLGNSLYMSVATMLLTVLIGSLASFALGRMRLRHGWIVTDFALLTYVLPTAFLVIPFVHLMHVYGLTDSLWAVIAAEVTFATPYAILILHQYGKLIPMELDESAKIDGATPMQVYLRIYVPLMAPALVAVGVYALLLAWNEYLYQYLLISSPSSTTVAVAIDQFFDSDEAPWNYMMATAMVYSLPPIAIYFALRRFMVAGLTMGGVKRLGRLRLPDTARPGDVSVRFGPGIVAVSVLMCAAAKAQTAVPLVIALPPVEIVGAAPLLGSGVDRGKVPATTHVLTSDDISRTGMPGLVNSLDEHVAGVALDDAAGNQFQPALLYRGFTASPLDGTAEGLAVYVNGARFNLPFGDTVNWDLIPAEAIDTANLEGSNPVFGLNALGGSLSVQLKNGFTYHGGEAVLTGGSFGRVQGAFQYGKQSGNFAAYVAGGVLHDGGWRQAQSSDLHQFFGDAGWRSDRGEVHVNVLAARDGLSGPGTVPVELLDVERNAHFTAPDAVQNTFARVSVTGNYDVTDTTSLQGVLYYTSLLQKVVNSNTPGFQVCGAFLCEQPDVVLTDRQAQPIPDFLNGGNYGELDNQTINTNGYGGAVQASNKDPLFGMTNQFVSGIAFDGGVTTFSASSEAGALSPGRDFIGPGIVIDQADGSIAPVRVGITNAYYGLYATDILDVTPQLSLNLSGRLNLAQIDLHDQIGTALTGDHFYAHFNPGVGATYTFTRAISVYGSFSVANRAPTPAELSCASITSPCTLANFFVADPNLKQVVAQTAEVGLRGRLTPYDGATLHWNVGLYHTNVSDDIVFLPATIPGRDFFQNVGHTRRQGIEAGLTWQTGRLQTWLDYAFTDATFQSSFTEDSPLNPAANGAGQIQVSPGNRLPGVPRHRVKLGLSYDITEAWTVGGTAIASSGQYLFGDEANLTPQTGGYVVLNLNTKYRITPNIEIFGLVQNALNARYETYGTFSDTGSIPIAQAPGATNTRSLAPAPPIAGYGGVRVTF